MKKKISLKASIITVTVALVISLLGCIGYFTGQLMVTSDKYQDMYYDTLYQVSSVLINADRDLYQSMLAASQGYDIYSGFADIPEEYVDSYLSMKKADYHDNVKQTRERTDKAAQIAKTQETLYRETKAKSGNSFEDNYLGFLKAIDAWEALFDVDTFTGEWGNFNNDFEALREYLSEMTDICEEWALMEENIIKEDTQRRINYSVISFGIVAVLMIVIAVIIVRNMRKSLNEFGRIVHRLSGGDFSMPIEVKSVFKEFKELGDENEEMRIRLREAVSVVIEKADDVGIKAENTKNSIRDSQNVMNDISKAVENLALGATDMAGDVQNTAEITIDIGSAIDNVSDSVKETLNKVEQLSDSSLRLKGGLDILRKADEETDEKVEQVAVSVGETADVVNKISVAAGKIINIASQTNLLALNASIEAARAGEAGRGFSVVAENIKNLATESDRLAGEITSMLNEINVYSERNMGYTAGIKASIEKENESLEKMIESFEEMLAVLDQAKSENEDAAKQTVNMSSKKEGILNSVESLSSISEENAASSEETSASLDQLNANMENVVSESERLHSIALELKKSVEFFKI